MPLYAHECEACRVQLEELRPAEHSGRRPPCPTCGKPMPRDYRAEARKGAGAFQPYEACSGGAAALVEAAAETEGLSDAQEGPAAPPAEVPASPLETPPETRPQAAQEVFAALEIDPAQIPTGDARRRRPSVIPCPWRRWGT